MTDSNKGPIGWAPEEMIRNAKALRKVAKQLEISRQPSEPDSLLLAGKTMAGPILLTLAVEIALKAWQCRERNGAPDHCHDLLKLFEGLRPGTQDQLEKLFPEEPDPLNTHGVWPIGAGMRKTLEYHTDAFMLWRYLHEVDLGARFFTNSLDAALTVIIKAFDSGLED